MKARESNDISSATPKIQCQVSVEEEKAVLFLIVILQELRVQTEIIDFGRSASKLLLCSSLCGSWKKGKFAWAEAAAANSSKVKAVDRNLIWCKYAKHVNLSSCPAVPKHFLKGKKAISMTTVNPGKSGFVFTKN